LTYISEPGVVSVSPVSSSVFRPDRIIGGRSTRPAGLRGSPQDDEIERKATLEPAGADTDAAGEAEVEFAKAAPASQEVEFSVRNVEPGVTFTFAIDGTDVAVEREVRMPVSNPWRRRRQRTFRSHPLHPLEQPAGRVPVADGHVPVSRKTTKTRPSKWLRRVLRAFVASFRLCFGLLCFRGLPVISKQTHDLAPRSSDNPRS
jgi:hypothetical protein